MKRIVEVAKFAVSLSRTLTRIRVAYWNEEFKEKDPAT
jgi:hypothetical protein